MGGQEDFSTGGNMEVIELFSLYFTAEETKAKEPR